MRMLLGAVVPMASNVFHIALICIVAAVCCNVAKTKRVGEAARPSALRPVPLQDVSIANDDSNLIDKRSLLTLLTLRVYCLENPHDCKTDQPNFAPLCDILGDDLACGSPTYEAALREENNDIGITSRANTISPNRSLPLSPNTLNDELDEGQSWTPRLERVASERSVGFQDRQQELWGKISDLLAGLEQQYGTTPTQEFELQPAVKNGERSRRLKRDQAQVESRRISPYTYRVTLQEAKRLIRAHQRQQQMAIPATLANPSLAMFTPELLARVPLSNQHYANTRALMAHPAAQATTSFNTNGANHLMAVPKRTGPTENPTQDMTTSGEDGEPMLTTSANPTMQPLVASELDESMQCNMRRFTYRAVKTDEHGNQCSGFIMASICYGGCDTGEFANWLFPHKKSVHKVCRHGTRARRQVRLSNCTSAAGIAIAPSNLETLSLYHYVDALDCVCKRCSAADTTCLGTLARPHLQTLGEAVSEMSQQPSSPQPQPAWMGLVDDDEGDGEARGGGGD